MVKAGEMDKLLWKETRMYLLMLPTNNKLQY